MAEVTSSRSFGATTPRTNGDTGARGDGLVDKLRQGAATQLNTQMHRATDGLGNVVDAVRQSTQQLRAQHHDTIARYAEQAADQIDLLSQRLRNKDVTQLMADMQRLSRKQPALFIGGAFALGLFGARFFKSSARDESPAWEDERSARAFRGSTRQPDLAYSAHELSRPRDYQSTAEGDEDPGKPSTTGRPSSETGSPASGGAGGATSPAPARSRRGPQTERS